MIDKKAWSLLLNVKSKAHDAAKAQQDLIHVLELAKAHPDWEKVCEQAGYCADSSYREWMC